jgi:hypothetical protein
MKTTDSDSARDSPNKSGSLPPAPRVDLPNDLETRVMRSFALQRGLPRHAVVRQTVALTIGSWMIAVLVFIYAGGLRPTGRPLPLILGSAAGIGAIATVAGWAALGRGLLS